MARVAMSYAQYMQSERWARRRQAYYALHPRRCRVCKTTEGVDLHHRTYDRMGFELDADLVPLCQFHHAFVHQMHRYWGGSLSQATTRPISMARAAKNGRPARPKRASAPLVPSGTKLTPPAKKVSRKAARGGKSDPINDFFARAREAARAKDRANRARVE